MSKKIICRFASECNGCENWYLDEQTQMSHHLNHLRNLLHLDTNKLNQNNYVTLGPAELRNRADFSFENLVILTNLETTTEKTEHAKMGFYRKAEKSLMDIDQCLQMSPELQKVYTEFREIKIDQLAPFIRKASIRLRVGPTGQKGCWLDLANVDIQQLLQDSKYLSALLDAGFQIEIGQKAKLVIKLSDSKLLKLGPPRPDNWFKTISANNEELTLKCSISDFTQPSWLSAKKISEILLQWTSHFLKETKEQNGYEAHSECMKPTIRIIEFGPGVGQLTLPLLSKNYQVWALENNPKAVEVLYQNAELHGLEKNLHILHGDFQNAKNIESFSLSDKLNLRIDSLDLAVVNPPRSGLKDFVQTLISLNAQNCAYISCYPESLQKDLLVLQQNGYEIVDLRIVNQFPQTRHFETCVWLKRVVEG